MGGNHLQGAIPDGSAVVKYQSYLEYKESSVEWLGTVPKHWKVISLRYACEFLNRRRIPLSAEDRGKMTERIYPYYGASGIIDYVEDYIFDEKTILIAEDGANLLSRSTELAFMADGKYWVNNHAHILKPIKGPFEFWANLLCIVKYDPWITGSAQPKLSKENLGSIPLPFPSPEEQQTIAAFLDYKTAKIDALIAKKKALLEKLLEKRTALISHAVTKGLDPKAPMRDSGIDWLGEIPAHWESKRLKFLLSSPLKYGANEAAELTDPEFPRYIRITDVNEDGTLREETFRSLLPEIAEDYLLEDGDILLARSGATVGKSFIYKPSWGVAAYAGYLIRARLSDKMDADFTYQFFQSSCYWQWLNSIFIQATIQNVSAEKYANLVLPVPPKTEQEKIYNYLAEALKRFESQSLAARNIISRLYEYRSALITNAVTGKIDVRNFRLPEAEELVNHG